MKWSRIARKSDGCKEKRGRDAETKAGEKNKYGRGKEKAGRDEVLVARTIKEQMQKREKKRSMDTQKRPQRTAKLQLQRRAEELLVRNGWISEA